MLVWAEGWGHTNPDVQPAQLYPVPPRGSVRGCACRVLGELRKEPMVCGSCVGFKVHWWS